MNKKMSSKSMGSLASQVLKSDTSSNIQKTLAGSVLSQRNSNNQTGADLEGVAAKVLKSDRYSDITKSLAASIVSQSDKGR